MNKFFFMSSRLISVIRLKLPMFMCCRDSPRCSYCWHFLWMQTVLLLLDLIIHWILSLSINFLLEIKGLKIGSQAHREGRAYIGQDSCMSVLIGNKRNSEMWITWQFGAWVFTITLSKPGFSMRWFVWADNMFLGCSLLFESVHCAKQSNEYIIPFTLPPNPWYPSFICEKTQKQRLNNFQVHTAHKGSSRRF